MIVLGFLTGYGLMSVDLYLPAMPDVAETFDASASAVQVSLAASLLGIGAGQLLIGPLCDQYGRRKPALIGLVVFSAFSLGCALAPSLPLLVLFRFGQAIGGAAGIVAARAIARDLRSGRALADLYAALMIVTGLTPILAPVVGAQLMLIGSSWQAIFVAQAAFGALIALVALVVLDETLPAHRRSRRGFRETLRHFGVVGRDRRFLLMMFAGSCGVATAFSFVSGSTFVLQDIYGLSAQEFSFNFALSSVGLMVASQLSRLAPVHVRLLAGGIAMLSGSLVQVAAVATPLGVPGLVVGGFIMWCGFGALAPAAIAAAMAGHADTAGSAAAVFGSVQFGVAGLAGPLVGIAGSRSAVPLVVMVTFWSALALLCVVLARVRQPAGAMAP